MLHGAAPATHKTGVHDAINIIIIEFLEVARSVQVAFLFKGLWKWLVIVCEFHGFCLIWLCRIDGAVQHKYVLEIVARHSQNVAKFGKPCYRQTAGFLKKRLLRNHQYENSFVKVRILS